MEITSELLSKYTNNVKQVIVIRKDLNMRKGKMVAQGAHGSEGAVFSQGYLDENQENLIIPLKENNTLTPLGFWVTSNFKKVCVSVNSEEELLELHEKAKQRNIPVALIQDSGLTEFHGIKTYTALGIGPALNEEFKDLTDHLPLL